MKGQKILSENSSVAGQPWSAHHRRTQMSLKVGLEFVDFGFYLYISFSISMRDGMDYLILPVGLQKDAKSCKDQRQSTTKLSFLIVTCPSEQGL